MPSILLMMRSLNAGARGTFLLLGMVGVLVSCRKDEEVVEPPAPTTPKAFVRLTVAPMWDGVPFDKNVIYTNISDERIEVQLLKFYLGDVGLYGAAGDTTPVFDVDLFPVVNGPVVRTYKVAPGSFEGLHLGLGVPAALNGEDPVMWSADHPLSVTNGMYWTWATMYRFVIFDGRYDTVASNTGTPPYQFSIHTGRNACYFTRDLALPTTLVADDTLDLRLELDVSRFFYSSTDTLYMATEAQQHGAVGELPMSQKFSHMVLESMDLSSAP